MEEQKTKEQKPTSKEKDKEELPKLVEVYGKEVKNTEKVEIKEENSIKESKEKSEDKKGKNKTSEEIVKEVIGERQTLKTEVVPLTSEIRGKGDGKNKDDSSKDSEVKLKTSIAQDDIAFDNEIGSQRKAVRGVFGVGALVFLVIFGITGWAFYLKSVWLPKETVSEVVVEATSLPKATSTPVPTPKPLAREDITLDVLNGSGVTGLAGETATIFEDLGYVLGKVGNADSADENKLYVKEEKLNKLGVLYEDVLEDLKISSPAGYLDADDQADAQIVLGS